MNNFKPNFFCVPNTIFDNDEISNLSHCELAVLLFCCNKKGSTSNKFTVSNVSKRLGFHDVDVFNSLKKWVDYGLISIDYAQGLDSVFDSNIYAEYSSQEFKKPTNSEKSGFIYVLSNTGFDGVLKIGLTTKSVLNRVNELNRATATITPFKVEFSSFTNNVFDVEKKIHDFLSKERIHENKEFFEIDIDSAVNAVKKFIKE